MDIRRKLSFISLKLLVVQFSKDDTDILNETSLQPIKSGLRLMSEGGKFSLHEKFCVSYFKCRE
jgi:hypothetical protein